MRKLQRHASNLVLATAFLVGLVAACDALATSIDPVLAPRGMVLVGGFVVLEALFTQRIAVRERMAWTDQWRVSALEWLLIFVVVRIWTLLTAQETLVAQLRPWLRDPITAFDRRFVAFAMVAVVLWLAASLLGHDILLWSAERPPAVRLNRDTIDRDHFNAEQAEAVQRFDGRLFMLSGFTLAFATAALYLPASKAMAVITWMAVSGTLVTVIAALLLHSAAHFQQVTAGWESDGARIEPQVMRGWRRAGLIVVGLLLLVAPLGYLALVAPAPPVIPVVNALLVAMTLIVSLMIFLVTLLLVPIAWILSLLGGKPVAAPAAPTFQPPQLPVDQPPAGPRPLIPALIFWACIIVLIGLALLRYLQQRGDLGTTVRRFRIGRWLIRLRLRLRRDARSFATVARKRWRRVRARPAARPTARGAPPQLQALYRDLVKAGQSRGVPHTPATTPHEWERAAGDAVPPALPDLQDFTATYLAAEYGPQAPDAATIDRGRERWRRLRRWFSRSEPETLSREPRQQRRK